MLNLIRQECKKNAKFSRIVQNLKIRDSMENNSLLLNSKKLHEIHNKLTTILGYSEILHDEDSFNQEQKSMINSISSAALSLKSLLSPNHEESFIEEPSFQDELPTMHNKVLIVDDNEDNRLVLETILKKYPLKIFIAKNGSEAITIANKEDPQLIFMDLNLPDISGQEASKLIRQNHKEIKIIALTGDLCAIEKEIQKKDLFELCIAKPFNRKQIQTIIQTYTNQFSIESNMDTQISKEYLERLIKCATMGQLSCLEDIIAQCHDDTLKNLLNERLLAFDFEAIISISQAIIDRSVHE